MEEDRFIDQRKNESWNTVSVVFGILAYILLSIKSVTWTIVFAIFAFKTDLPECIATNGIQQSVNFLEQMSQEPEIEIKLAQSQGRQVNVT